MCFMSKGCELIFLCSVLAWSVSYMEGQMISLHLRILNLLLYFACRCFVSSVWRRNKAVEDAK